MSDLGLIIPKINLFSNHKHGVTAADDAQNGDSFQQQLSQALGVSAQAQAQTGIAGAGDAAADSAADVAALGSGRDIRPVSVETAPASTVSDPSLASGNGLDQFRQYTAASLPQQMFYTMLSSMGVSKDQFEAMTPQQQAQLTQQLQERLKQAAAAGQLPGVSGLAQGAAAAPVQAAAASAPANDALSGLRALL